jgi:hypothetical protein
MILAYCAALEPHSRAVEPLMKAPTPRLLDRLATLRGGLERSGTKRGGHQRRRVITVMVALVIVGGLTRLALDDEVAETALPEPPPPAYEETGASETLGRSLPASLVAEVRTDAPD